MEAEFQVGETELKRVTQEYTKLERRANIIRNPSYINDIKHKIEEIK